MKKLVCIWNSNEMWSVRNGSDLLWEKFVLPLFISTFWCLRFQRMFSKFWIIKKKLKIWIGNSGISVRFNSTQLCRYWSKKDSCPGNSHHIPVLYNVIFFSSFKIEWMKGSKLNICYNTLDRHLEKRASQVAFHWEGNDPKDAGKITYAELHKDVCKFANVLRSKGVKKVCVIYCRDFLRRTCIL